ncbi:MAG TPA: alpha/beta fold hydrolase [Candidatus Acidoferrum sp.]|nr:alpha/beta fold hydrolase [Candidatus Acidoferrum sp.]
MKMNNKTHRAIVGAGLCGLGLLLALAVPYQSHTFRIDAGGCRLVTDIVEPMGQPAGGAPQGFVVLLHGLSANKRIMSYITAGFAAEGLRVFVPDLPGHGRTAGPFSYERADQCSENLLRELIARGLLDPERTILAGHSLGGAIALRVASRVPVAGVVAFSPAPMRAIPGVSSEMMPFHDFGALPAHSLLMSAAWEPERIRSAVKSLLPAGGDGTNEYKVIPRSSHVSILFNGTAMASALNWSARVLHLESPPALPTNRGLLGFFAGFAGILLLAGPFLRETLQSKNQVAPVSDTFAAVATSRAFLECGIVSLGTVGILSYANPLRALHLFEGDYLASFLLILGVVLLVLHWKSLPDLFGTGASGAQPARSLRFTLLVAVFAAFLLHFLITAWIDLTFSEAWLTAPRWARFAPFFLAVLPYHAAEELLLGPALPGKGLRRLFNALLLRVIAWCAIVAGIFVLHSGEILLVLLVPSFGIFCLLQRWGMNVVREVTASPAAAALFGAILLAGFCLVVFPTT